VRWDVAETGIEDCLHLCNGVVDDAEDVHGGCIPEEIRPLVPRKESVETPAVHEAKPPWHESLLQSVGRDPSCLEQYDEVSHSVKDIGNNLSHDVWVAENDPPPAVARVESLPIYDVESPPPPLSLLALQDIQPLPMIVPSG